MRRTDREAGRAWILGLLILGFGLGGTPARAQRAAVERGQQYTQEAFAAKEAGDAATYLERLQQALAHRPNHPGLIYRLAGAYLLNDRPREALATLGHYAALGLTADPLADATLAGLTDVEGFTAILERLRRNAEPTGKGSVALRLDAPAFVPEGVVHDPATGAFFIGSVHQGLIMRLSAAGEPIVFAGRGDSLWSVLGLAVDARRRRLWVGSAAMPHTKGLPEAELGRSRVLAFDLDTGQVLQVHDAPADTASVLGDLTVAPDGKVWVSDAVAGALYRVDPEAGTMEPFLPPQTLVSPQGLCFFGPEHHLVVADYSIGLMRVDAESGALTALAPPDDATLLGIDGLACHDNHLLAVQNGVAPQRVLAITLDDAASRIQRTEVLIANHPLFDEPTLGTVVGEEFYFVANSHWNRFDREGRLPPDVELTTPVVLRVAIP